jgi:hypothetical protein
MNEADTCRTYVIPKLKSAGWEDETITEQLVLISRPIPPIEDRHQAKVNALRELQFASGEELFALMPSVLNKAFKGEL